jgi:hypothetical protein
MRKIEGTLIRVLIVAALAAVAFTARPGLSFADSALQLVVQENDSNSNLGFRESELKITNTTPTTLCANIYYYFDSGTPACCSGCLVSPFASLSTDAAADTVSNFSEGSIFILSGSTIGRRGVITCDATIPNALPGLRSWLMVDDEGAVGVNAQDVSASTSGTIQKLASDCASNKVDCGACTD